MSIHHHRTWAKRSTHVRAVSVGALVLVAFAITALLSNEGSGALSPEVKFTDLSKSGLQIVPASCPSSPNYDGQCDAPPPPPPCNPNIQFNCAEKLCALSASTYTSTSGQPVTLYWDYYAGPQVNNVAISPTPGLVYGGGSTGLVSGTVTVSPTVTTEYDLTDSDQETSSQDCNATITVVPAAPTCSVTFAQNPIAYGSQTTLTYSSMNATAFYINNIGYVGASGSTVVGPLATTDYTGSAGDGTSTTTCPASLTVNAPSSPSATIAASSSSIYTGHSTNLTATFSAGSGDTLTADNIDHPLGTGLAANSTPGSKYITFSPTVAGTYTFYAEATTNYYSSWASYASMTVTVTQAPSCTPATQYICTGSGNQTITASSTDASCNHTSTTATSCVSPTFCSKGSSVCFYPAMIVNNNLQAIPSIVKLGSTTKISWSVSNAQSCTVTGTNGDSWSGASSQSGGYTSKAIAGQTTYTLTCSAPGDATTTQSMIVGITPTYQEN